MRIQQNLLEIFNPENLEISNLMGDFRYEKVLFDPISMDELMQPHDIAKNWNCYCPEIYDLIVEYVNSGKYAYNRDVENLVMEKYGYTDADLSHIVYTTQSYKHMKDAIINAVKVSKELTENGWIVLENLEMYVGQKFQIRETVSDLIGNSRQRKSEKAYLLIKDAAGQFFFIKTRASRKGFKVFPGTYVKPVKVSKEEATIAPAQTNKPQLAIF